jgi:hypothetical protein
VRRTGGPPRYRRRTVDVGENLPRLHQKRHPRCGQPNVVATTFGYGTVDPMAQLSDLALR